MTTKGLRLRQPPVSVPVIEKLKAQRTKTPDPTKHPAGKVKHGLFTQTLRMYLFGVYFAISIIAIAITQYIGLPLYFYSRDLFYAWMAMSKQHFGSVVMTMTYWWAPVTMRVSGDESVRGQLRKSKDGKLECDFPERLLYTDWVYIWWTCYTASMHGHLYIILKESLKYIPVLGWGMKLFGFIFLSRKWSTDKERFQHRLRKLSTSHSGPLSGSKGLDPMWLLIFPEGTNLSTNGRESSQRWAAKNNMPDLRHALLPRSTGLSFCLQELKGSIGHLYDCTVAYEGVPVGQYGQDLFTLRGTYFQGRPPKSVNMYWRRFAIADIPLHDEKEFSDWLLARWREKDDLLQYFVEHQRFPADDGVTPNVNGGEPLQGPGWIETDIRPNRWWEWLQIFVPTAALGLVVNVFVKIAGIVMKVARVRD
ncbi:1-acyl-sn-glycerol-3-phosphate acyltransferase 2 [Pyrenophora tritici-repentis Pt-1C-BFP]|uniref:1-acyl-sn-glycerol-3-phosphate acyltransferase 2 n=1 Tax=Pyrenophora tritici-repentis (strain Pt-1C-BFP) TaxID=426418 RepID=B2VVT3_PYRTR|nr:1-acyl-sn-glycerol-3-phosphate acyltransferase 2 [Pyrenophora tritici-repentis Pt-1C-BFP]EDU40733.1 1-acyl-sn-glycerol-3-phosphate acyltransferase 2 [Pyrenophora tritici-repentis Pt-1C-BFP]